MVKKTWSEFKDAGLLWWVNRGLHLFGWAIVFEIEDGSGEITSVYPARVTYRGFSRDSEEKGYEKLTNHLKDNIQDIAKDFES